MQAANAHELNPTQTPIMLTMPDTNTYSCKVIRRNGQVTDFDGSKIQVAMTKAFLDVEGSQASGSARIHDTVRKLTAQVVEALLRRTPEGGMVHIEDIQDQVELALMRAGEHKVARSYVLYRAERARLRAEKDAKSKKKGKKSENIIHVKMASGDLKPLDEERLRKIVAEAVDGLEGVSAEQVMTATMRNLYDGISEKEVATALVISTRVMIDREPNYSQAAARMLMDSLRREALSFLEGQHTEATQHEMIELVPGSTEKDHPDRGARLSGWRMIWGVTIWRNWARRLSRNAICSLLTLVCKRCMTVISCIMTGCVLSCRRCFSCAWRWVWRLTKSSAKIGRLSFTTCCPALIS